jgi:hypothetical protein
MAYLHRVAPAKAEAFFPVLKLDKGVAHVNFTEEGGYDVCTIQMVAKRYWSQAIETFEIAQLDSGTTRHSATLRALESGSEEQ